MEPIDGGKQRVLLVDCLAVFFGIGAWISINGLWVELPLLVQAAPEGWALPSYMSIVIQIANIGPITYSVLHLLLPNIVTEKPSIYLLMVIGVLSSLLIAFFWDTTSDVGGDRHSTGLLALLFCLSLVDCSSSVLFMPFMARFRHIYLTSYLIGEGLSGFLPSLFALAQGVGGNPTCVNSSTGELAPFYPEPRFSVSAFFFILMAMMLGSAAAFFALNHSSAARRERAEMPPPCRGLTPVDNVNFTASNEQGVGTSINAVDKSPTDLDGRDGGHQVATRIPKSVLIYLLALQCWVCALSNGALPSIQSYSCLPYGNIAYHLAVTLSAMANPVACLVAYFLPITNVCLVAVFVFLGTTVSGYILALAALSPEPPLVGLASGETLMVLSWILCVGLLTYVKASIASVLRMENGRGKRNLFWFGVSTQIGSLIGSVVSFLLVNVYYLFEAYYPCA